VLIYIIHIFVDIPIVFQAERVIFRFLKWLRQEAVLGHWLKR